MKKFWNKYKGAIIVVVLLALFVLLSVLTEEGNKKNSKDDINLDKLTSEVKAWVDATESDEYIVTVLAQTTCSHCIAYKPVIESLQKQYGFKLYWYEVNELYEEDERKEDYKAVTEYYDLKSYNGTPHTYITKSGELVVEQGGAVTDEAELKEFLKNNHVITE